MEFGVFAQLFVPKFERDVDPNAEHKRIMRNVEVAHGRRPQRLQVRVVPASTTSSTSTRTCPGPRCSSSLRRRQHRAHPPRLGDLQHHAAGEQAGPHRRDRRPARPPHRQPLRVRHRPRLVDHRGLRLRHRRPQRDQGDVARGDPRDPEDVEGQASTRTRASTSACPSARSSRSRTARRTRRCGSPRGSPPTFAEAGELGLGAFCFTTGTPDADRAARRRPTRTPSPTPRRSATTSTTTSWASPTCSAWRTASEAFEVAVDMRHELLHEPRVPLARQHPEARRASRSGRT